MQADIIDVGLIWLMPVAAVLSIVVAYLLSKSVAKAEPGNEDMVRVQGYIRQGAEAFIKRQYITLAMFVAVLAVVISIVYGATAHKVDWYIMLISYLSGSIASAAAGWIGLKVGVTANSPTAWASQKGLPEAFNISFFGGAVMGLLVTGLAMLGVWFLLWLFSDPIVVLGFSFGASSIALFAKAGGGIYTKTADVGADLVGKIEYSLPEDDSRNPAAVADNVGDNVGDIAGMGCDLFDSYVASMLAAMMLGFATYGSVGIDGQIFAVFPGIISAAGLFASLIGIFIVRKLVKSSPGSALNMGTYIATGLYIGISALFVLFLQLSGVSATNSPKLWLNWLSGVFGVIVGLIIGLTTDYFTDDNKKPTQLTAEAGQKGHAIVILTGFSFGLLSVLPPIIGIAAAMAISYALDGVVGVANAAVGMLAIVGTIVSNDAYGPIVDNSRSLAEQGHLDEKSIEICDKLDSAGNTAKAVTKGFAIGAAALTVLAILYSYSEEAGSYLGAGVQLDLNLMKIDVMIGAVIGCAIPPVYSAVLIRAVDKNAAKMVDEIRRQFTENPKILEPNSKVPADYAKCVDIATKGALQELIVPVLLSVGSPLLTGILFGAAALGSFLASAILTGLVFALMMSNAGGMWDNAKKYVESGNYGGKGSFAHAATVTGDTVGDPFKDTAGPSINTLITVMGLTATMFISLFFAINNGHGVFGL